MLDKFYRMAVATDQGLDKIYRMFVDTDAMSVKLHRTKKIIPETLKFVVTFKLSNCLNCATTSSYERTRLFGEAGKDGSFQKVCTGTDENPEIL